MIRLASLALAVAGGCLALPAAAQFSKPADAIKYRQSAMFLQQMHFNRIFAMTSGRVPYDPAAMVANAEVLAMVTQLPWAGFGPGTEGGQAKPDIWKEPAKFKENSDKLPIETAKLLAAAKANDLEAVKAAARSVGGTCKACHDAFQKE